MKIDERLLAYKPISVTLNFDWENTTYDERVQKTRLHRRTKEERS
jgi:hypothetical protein